MYSVTADWVTADHPEQTFEDVAKEKHFKFISL